MSASPDSRGGCARDSDWCDGVICRENGIDCPKQERPASETFAERLRIELARQRVRQVDLAERLGHKQPIVSQWCSGTRQPRLNDLAHVAAQLSVTTDYLLGLADA